jgi:hypothetical protein
LNQWIQENKKAHRKRNNEDISVWILSGGLKASLGIRKFLKKSEKTL